MTHTVKHNYRVYLPALVAITTACGGAQNEAETSGEGGASTVATLAGSTTSATASGSSGGGAEGGAGGETPFERPDPPDEYVPKDGNCGFEQPAFCETFEAGPQDGGRSGELDPTRFSVARGMPYNPSSFDDAFRIGPALIGECRTDLSHVRVLPDSDVLVCDPVATIPTRHALATAAAQNYGLSTYRVRQPFDFEGRTGTIQLDIDLTNNGLGGWPALIIAEDPSPTPSFDWQERGSGPKNGVSIEFGTGWCNTPQTLETIIYTYEDYVQTSFVPSFDCEIPHATTAPDSLNHVIVYLTQDHLEVWVSDVSPDGVTFPNLQMLWEGDVSLPFSRGYVSLALRNHATIKYWLGSAAMMRFDNLGFDGPKVTGYREYSAPDSLTTYSGLGGCAPDGGECEWEGDVIATHPDGASCAETHCDYDGEGRNVGYTIPRVDEDVAPVALDFSGVDLSGMTRARLVLGATYPTFDWNDVSHPPTYIALRYRVNGGEWHDRNVSEVEANAFTDFFPELGGAGAGAGLLNQAIDLSLDELVPGDNRVELLAANTWTGDYRVAVTGVDLVLDDQ
jgi:hypothetical protein